VGREAPFVSWQRLKDEYFRPLPGEHITLIGRTGRGKTTLATRGILPLFRYVIVIGTKEFDDSYPYLESRNFYLTEDPRFNPRRHPKILFRPGPFTLSREGQKEQMAKIAAALETIYAEGGWALYLDEVAYSSEAGLALPLETLWRVGRSKQITMIASTQNPVWIPRVAFDQVSHLFLWRQVERQRVERIAEMAGDLAPVVRGTLPKLPEYQFLYINTTDGSYARSIYPLRAAKVKSRNSGK
jgi:energy-coupling factor transporter ATP-binding protein EcfA2